jgi:ABC-type transport system involved in multi-copper enzyme maturation permease subunit
MKAWRVALHILRQNRWLLILLALWPCAIALVLLIPNGHLDISDIQVLMQQEGIYGIALAAFQAGALFRSEQRSRRIIQILACDVSRGKYLLALLLASLLPLVLYLGGFLFSGYLLNDAANAPMIGVYEIAVLIGILGIWTSCVAGLLSLVMPALLASAGSLLLLGGLFWLNVPPGQLLARAYSITAGGQFGDPRDLIIPLAVTAGEALIVFVLAWIIFSRRDLNLIAE